ncbi:MAG: hypothetical protein ACT4OY_05935 [Alphaproteobacteria bacterium]
MSHVEQSLRNLLGAIERLDHAARYFEGAQNTKQRDMFAAAPVQRATGSQDAMLARRLDVAIARVEELLSEEA